MFMSAPKLKSKAYFLYCRHHKYERNIEDFPFQETFEKAGIETSKELKFGKILKELSSGDFNGTASIIIIHNAYECRHIRYNLMDKVYNRISRNATLKYVTKIVLTYSNIIECFKKTHFSMRFKGKILKFKYPEVHHPPLLPLDEKEFQDKVIDTVYESSKYYNKIIDTVRQQFKATKIPNIDNLIVMDCLELGIEDGYPHEIYDTFLEKLMLSPEGYFSIQDLAKDTVATHTAYREIGDYYTNCAGGCYIFNLNPALALFINHLNVHPNIKKEIREGSLDDLKKLQDVYKTKKTPYITIEDGSSNDVKRLMAKIKKTKFIGLKYLYITVMAHGSEGDIIHTKTDSYNLNEVIYAPLLANPSLRGVLKFVLINACRGTFDPRRDDGDQPLVITDTSAQDEHLVKLNSTQKNCVSIREKDGAICIKEFVNVFKKPFYQLTLREMAREMEANLLQVWGDCFDRIIDYCARPATEHVIKIEFDNYKNHEEQLEDLRQFVNKYNWTQTFYNKFLFAAVAGIAFCILYFVMLHFFTIFP